MTAMTGARTAAAPANPRRPTPTALLYRTVQYLLLVALALFCVVPFAWVLLTSIDAQAGPNVQAPVPTWDNFVRFFADAQTLRMLVNSLVIAVGATVLNLAFGLLGGYALSRFRFPGRRGLMFFILIVRVVPPTATIVPLYLMLTHLNLDNGYLGLILVEAAVQLPITLWLLKGTVDAIPVELEEAAWVDGNTRLATIRRIVFPLVRPGLGAAAMFCFLGVWGDFLTPLVLLQSQELYPLSIGLFRAFSAFNQVDWGVLAASSIVYMAPPAILYLFVRRYLFRASIGGALKG